jgi:DNA transformation protein and related proteins
MPGKKPKPKPKILDELAAKLGSLPGYSTRPLFGGFGIYLGEQIFAILGHDRLFFHIDEETRSAYESVGMKPFEYDPGKFLKTYYELPKHVWNDEVLIKEWAVRAATRPVRKKKSKPKIK